MKKRYKIKINNKMGRAMGSMDPKTNLIQINLKAHKKKGKIDLSEVSSTLRHEMMHVKHPKMTEKEVYKKTAKTKISPQEQSKLISKLRHRNLNYKSGAIKRKFKMGKVESKPGDFISKMNEAKITRSSTNQPMSKEKISIMALV